MQESETIWQYEICDVANTRGMEDADVLLLAGWEPFAATEGGYIGDKITTVNLWLRKKVGLAELEEEEK